METLSHCPICNATQFTQFIECMDYTVSRETFQIVQCNNCSFKFTNPRPTENEMGRYYESDDYISHSNSRKGLFNLAYQAVRNFALKRKLKLIESFHSQEKNLIDIGCGTGEFLGKANDTGWKTIGLEPSENARKYATEQNKLTVYDLDYLKEIKPQSFDVITMWHVLEHVPNLQEFIPQLKDILKDYGTLLIAVPNCNAYESKIYNVTWAAYDVPRHLNHFNKETINKLLITNGLVVKNIIPMPFDAFYISMLSEKYKGAGFIRMAFNGFINGLKSNRKSKTDVNLASSLIYEIKKEI
ncbi:MAG: class I SAM-dependent methyltransferase [Bacteroidia bacterium]